MVGLSVTPLILRRDHFPGLLHAGQALVPEAGVVQVGIMAAGSKIEYTLYPPSVDRSQFLSAHNYPIKFLKFPDEEVPTSPFFTFNSGEEGIEDRKPNYLIIDSLTYSRFSDEYICQINPADCDFFTKLLAGETNYTLVKAFEYDLPDFIPEVNLAFLNSDILIFKRNTP